MIAIGNFKIKYCISLAKQTPMPYTTKISEPLSVGFIFSLANPVKFYFTINLIEKYFINLFVNIQLLQFNNLLLRMNESILIFDV